MPNHVCFLNCTIPWALRYWHTTKSPICYIRYMNDVFLHFYKVEIVYIRLIDRYSCILCSVFNYQGYNLHIFFDCLVSWQVTLFVLIVCVHFKQRIHPFIHFGERRNHINFYASYIVIWLWPCVTCICIKLIDWETILFI